jgi:hypothetical protein
MSIDYDRQELLQFVTLQRGVVMKSVLRLHVVRFRTMAFYFFVCSN